MLIKLWSGSEILDKIYITLLLFTRYYNIKLMEEKGTIFKE